MKLRPEDVRPVSEEDPLKLFHASIRATATDVGYTRRLRRFLCKVLEDILHGSFEERAKEFVEIGRNEPEIMLDILLKFSGAMRERTEKDKNDPGYLNPSSVPHYFSPITKLLEANDVTVNWNRVTQTYPERDNVDSSRGWTREEIRLMLDHAKEKKHRAIILVLASSGMRSGGLRLRWGDLTRIYGVDGRMVTEEDLEEPASGEPACVAVRVYRNSVEEHVTFITPEAYQALMEYAVEWEAKVGRKPGSGDPIFIRKTNLPTMFNPTPFTSVTLLSIALRAGVNKTQRDKSAQGNVPPANGFRRFFNKTMRQTRTTESMVAALTKIEFMIGHKGITALDRNYYKTNPQELAETYVNAIPNLTIGGSERPNLADRRSDEAVLELDRPDARLRTLAWMLEQYHTGEFADSDNPVEDT